MNEGWFVPELRSVLMCKAVSIPTRHSIMLAAGEADVTDTNFYET